MKTARTCAIAVALAQVLACSSSDDARTADAPLDACGAADEVPSDLACTGLYTDIRTKALAPNARGYAPAVSFWSDGYEKERFIVLPDGATIDASNVDDWRFPVGTKVWKEIRKGGRKIETRYFTKVKDTFWQQAAYVWSEDGLSATRGEGRDVIVDGKPYHVPSTTDCNDCHRGRKDKVLGFEAISLGQPGAAGLTLAKLVEERRLVPAPARTTVTVVEPALATLHVNCGITCHNGTANASAGITGLRFRLGFDEVANKPVTEWDVSTTTVGVPATSPGWNGDVRVTPGEPDASLVLTVMKLRGEGQMPPIATNDVDTASVAAVEAWVRALPVSR